VENLNVSIRCGWMRHLRQIRATLANEIPSSAARNRADQRVTLGGHDHGGVSKGHGAPNPKRHVHTGRSRGLTMTTGVPHLGHGKTNPKEDHAPAGELVS
jgi:hypothetical protein